MTYRDAGVDIEAGAELVRRIQGLNPDIGGFGGLFPLGDSYLVAGCDGVGTKLKVAFEMEAHKSIGQDLVAMSVNDIITTGAAPLFFLDYFGTGALDVDVAQEVVQGIADACKRSDCVLLGGETAEMPDFYQRGEYDLSGFAVGIVKKHELVDGKKIRAGDVLVGVPSSGVHSNGFSLVRRILDVNEISLNDPFTDGFGGLRTVGDVLIEPTMLYPASIAAIKAAASEGGVLGMAHVTGGGFTENIPRVLPDGLGVRIDVGSWEMHPVFPWIQSVGKVPEDEMYKTFNMGVGMVVVMGREDAEAVMASGDCSSFGVRIIGEVVRDNAKGVRYAPR